MGTSVSVRDVTRGEDLVGELGAGFEGKRFGEDERVVAVKEEGGDLWVVSSVKCGKWERKVADLRSHLDCLTEDQLMYFGVEILSVLEMMVFLTSVSSIDVRCLFLPAEEEVIM